MCLKCGQNNKLHSKRARAQLSVIIRNSLAKLSSVASYVIYFITCRQTTLTHSRSHRAFWMYTSSVRRLDTYDKKLVARTCRCVRAVFFWTCGNVPWRHSEATVSRFIEWHGDTHAVSHVPRYYTSPEWDRHGNFTCSCAGMGGRVLWMRWYMCECVRAHIYVQVHISLMYISEVLPMPPHRIFTWTAVKSQTHTQIKRCRDFDWTIPDTQNRQTLRVWRRSKLDSKY